MAKTGRPRTRSQALPPEERAAARRLLRDLRAAATPRLTQEAVAAALGLSEATVRGWESKSPGKEPTREQVELLDDFFATKRFGPKSGVTYEKGQLLRTWGLAAVEPKPREAAQDTLVRSEENAWLTQAFNFTLDSDVGAPGETRGYLGATVVANLRADPSHRYQYILAPPFWMRFDHWIDYIENQIVTFQEMCVREAQVRVLGQVEFTLLRTYADLAFSFDLHHKHDNSVVAFVCEEIPDRIHRMNDNQRLMVEISNTEKLRSVWAWLGNISRDVGTLYSPLSQFKSLKDVRREFLDAFDPNAGEWEFIRRLIQEEVRAEWTVRGAKS